MSTSKITGSVALRFYNARNLGDDLFVKILADRYQNRFLIGQPIPHSRKFSQDPFLDLENVELAESRLEYYAAKIFDRIFRKKTIVNIRRILRSQILVYTGGSIFIEGKNREFWHREERSYRKLPIPYAIVGANFGPWKTQDFVNLVRSILSGSVDTCFRDKDSHDQFSEIALARYASDIVFSLDTSNLSKITSRNNAVVSVVETSGRFRSSVVNAYEELIVKAVSELVTQGRDVTLMSFCRVEGDEEVIRRIIYKLPDHICKNVTTYFYRGNINQALSVICRSNLVIGTRFHSVILALLLNKPVIPIAYSDKTLTVLKDIGFDGKVFDLRIDTSSDLSKDDLLKATTFNVQKQIVSSELQFAILDDLLIRRNH